MARAISKCGSNLDEIAKHFSDDVAKQVDEILKKSLDDVVGGAPTSKFQEVFDLADNYKLSDDTFNNHILDRHGSNSAYSNKSHFNKTFDIKNEIKSTLTGDNFILKPNSAGREGFIFEQTFTSPIGVNSKGSLLYTLKVVIDESGNVITAFPK